MTAPHIQSVLQAMIETTEIKDTKKRHHRKHPVVVTISRDLGSVGNEIAQKLADRLGVELYDHIIIEKLAERLSTDQETVKALDESVGRARDLWLFRLLTGVDVTPGGYRRHLVNIILSLARVGGVIVGRGAHVVLDTGAALRVRITGSTKACAERVAAKEGIPFEDARKMVEKTNHNRGKFVWDMFKSRLNEPQNYDIVINTDRLTDVDSLVETLVQGVNAIHTAVEAEEAKHGGAKAEGHGHKK